MDDEKLRSQRLDRGQADAHGVDGGNAALVGAQAEVAAAHDWAFGSLAAGAALADPPGRVARLANITGTVSFSPAGEEDWVLAQANRPLIAGDRVWADAGSIAELQIGAAAVRLGAETSVDILSLDDRTAQFQLAQGELNVRVRRISGDQVFEVDTPNLAFSIRRPGDYRIDVDPAGNATTVRVRGGEGEAWGEGAAYVIGAGQQYTFQGTGLRDYSTDPLPPPDDFDRWVKTNVIPQRQPGYTAVTITVPMGNLTPEQIAAVEESYTGQFLRAALTRARAG